MLPMGLWRYVLGWDKGRSRARSPLSQHVGCEKDHAAPLQSRRRCEPTSQALEEYRQGWKHEC